MAEKLIEDLTQTTPDGQRVIETYEVDEPAADDTDAPKATVTRERAATLAEQVEQLQQEVLNAVLGLFSLARSGEVEVGGSDEAPTVTLTLSMMTPDEAAAEQADKPAAAAPSKAKATADKSS